jgi:hypothetical protein
MRRRLLISNVILVTVVLLALEIPLALVYARHEHDLLDGALQRDATSLAALSEEIIEHPGEHDVGNLAQRFGGSGTEILIVDRSGNVLTPGPSSSTTAAFTDAVTQARGGHTSAGVRTGAPSSPCRSDRDKTPTEPCSWRDPMTRTVGSTSSGRFSLRSQPQSSDWRRS